MRQRQNMNLASIRSNKLVAMFWTKQPISSSKCIIMSYFEYERVQFNHIIFFHDVCSSLFKW